MSGRVNFANDYASLAVYSSIKLKTLYTNLRSEI